MKFSSFCFSIFFPVVNKAMCPSISCSPVGIFFSNLWVKEALSSVLQMRLLAILISCLSTEDRMANLKGSNKSNRFIYLFLLFSLHFGVFVGRFVFLFFLLFFCCWLQQDYGPASLLVFSLPQALFCPIFLCFTCPFYLLFLQNLEQNQAQGSPTMS